MKKETDLQKLSCSLQSVFGSKNWQALWETHKLVEQWSEVAGKTIASKSSPAYIQKNILWIYVHDSVWMQQLQALKPQVLENVRDYPTVIDIRDIRWILQPHLAEKKQDSRPNTSSPGRFDPTEQKDFEKIAESIENKECRSALNRLWKVYHKN